MGGTDTDRHTGDYDFLVRPVDPSTAVAPSGLRLPGIVESCLEVTDSVVLQCLAPQMFSVNYFFYFIVLVFLQSSTYDVCFSGSITLYSNLSSKRDYWTVIDYHDFYLLYCVFCFGDFFTFLSS